jgi:hypothetical protein
MVTAPDRVLLTGSRSILPRPGVLAARSVQCRGDGLPNASAKVRDIRGRR